MSFNEWKFADVYKEKVDEDFYDPVKCVESSSANGEGMLFDSVSRIMRAVSVVEKTSGDIFRWSRSSVETKLRQAKRKSVLSQRLQLTMLSLKEGWCCLRSILMSVRFMSVIEK